MFQEDDDKMHTSAGTPAFLAPEACQSGVYAGKAADIWAAGATLYVFLFGRVPFYSPGIMGIYSAIIHDELVIPPDTNPLLEDLLQKIMEKNPDNRITMEEIFVHPWVTAEGTSPLEPVAGFDEILVGDYELSNAIIQGEEMKMIDKFVLIAKMKGRLQEVLGTARERIKRRNNSRPMSAIYHRSRMASRMEALTESINEESSDDTSAFWNNERITSAPHPLNYGLSSTTVISTDSSLEFQLY